MAGFPSCTLGQSPDPANLRGESGQTRKRLSESEQKLLAGNSADATDGLQRILDESGDDLISLDGTGYRPARWVAHQILSKLPAADLKNYQNRIDGPAAKLLQAGKLQRDPRPLWKLLDRYFVSRPASEAILLLGDLQFEQGDFRTAERLWRRLLPDGSADIVYPGSTSDPAQVWARVILAMHYQGDSERAQDQLMVFKTAYPDARGVLAGKDDVLAKTLGTVLDREPATATVGPTKSSWLTAGGTPDRASRVEGRLPAYWPARPTWSVELPSNPGRFRNGPSEPPGRQPFGHPIVVGNKVFVTDGTRLYAFDLLAKDSVQKPTTLFLNPPAQFDAVAASPDLSPTLSAEGKRLYVRLGLAVIRAPDPTRSKKPGDDTAIACIHVDTNGDGSTRLKELWRIAPPQDDAKAAVYWEGSPLVVNRKMWGAFARIEGGRVIHGIACYDPADATSAPDRPRWTTEVSDSPLSVSSEGRTRHDLLTLAGRYVVHNTNSGTVVALDAQTGMPAWAFRYNSARRNQSSTGNTPAPAVASGGRVFVAPTDADHVFALDQETGQLLWQSGETLGASIVGVARNRLIISTTGPVRGIRALGVRTGSHRSPEGWVQHDGEGLLGYGTGFVNDHVIVWPTRVGLFFLRSADGTPMRPPFTSPIAGRMAGFLGNVIYSHGVLIVVAPAHIWGYVSEQSRHRDAHSTRHGEMERFNRLTVDAESALERGDRAAAEQALQQAARSGSGAAQRAWATARLLQLHPPVNEFSKLNDTLRALLTPELQDEWLYGPDGLPVTLRALLDRLLGCDSITKAQPTSRVPSDYQSGGSPALKSNAAVQQSLTLPIGSFPLAAIPGMPAPRQIFVATPERLLAIPLSGGSETWHHRVDHPTHAATTAEGFVVTGSSSVAMYGAGRSPEWVFRVPVVARLPQHNGEWSLRDDREVPAPKLSAFRLTGSWLLARLGEQHLIALDLRSRRVAWVLGSDGQAGYQPAMAPGAPQFGAEFHAAGRSLLVQLTHGQRWLVDVPTGKITDAPGLESDTSKVWWVIPPAEVEPNRLAVSDGAGLVRMLNLATGRVKWTHQEHRVFNLTGEPPQVRAWGPAILVAFRRNHGVELSRLDMSDGTSTWPGGAVFLDTDRISLAHADADDSHIYVAVGNRLVAYDLRDGHKAWEQELQHSHGAAHWVIRAGRKNVMAYPEAAIPREPLEAFWNRALRGIQRDPSLERLLSLSVGAYDAWVRRSVPLSLFDPQSGQPAGQFEIPARGPTLSVWFERDTTVVATGDRVVWLR